MPLKKWCVGFNLKYNIQTTYENLLYILVLIKESFIGEEQFQFYLNKHKWKKCNYKGYKIVNSDTIDWIDSFLFLQHISQNDFLIDNLKKFYGLLSVILLCIFNVLQGKKFATWSFTVSLPIEEEISFQTS